MSSFINKSLFTEVLLLCRCWTFLEANDSPGLRTCFGGLWTCAQCAGGPLHEVFYTGSVCTFTESTCCAVVAVVAGVEGVVVLKGVSISGTMGTILELYWHCMALCLFHMSFSIWNTLDVPFEVPLAVLFPVLTQDIPFGVPFGVPFSVLPPFILLKLGMLSPLITFSSG